MAVGARRVAGGGPVRRPCGRGSRNPAPSRCTAAGRTRAAPRCSPGKARRRGQRHHVGKQQRRSQQVGGERRQVGDRPDRARAPAARPVRCPSFPADAAPVRPSRRRTAGRCGRPGARPRGRCRGWSRSGGCRGGTGHRRRPSRARRRARAGAAGSIRAGRPRRPTRRRPRTVPSSTVNAVITLVTDAHGWDLPVVHHVQHPGRSDNGDRRQTRPASRRVRRARSIVESSQVRGGRRGSPCAGDPCRTIPGRVCQHRRRGRHRLRARPRPVVDDWSATAGRPRARDDRPCWTSRSARRCCNRSRPDRRAETAAAVPAAAHPGVQRAGLRRARASAGRRRRPGGRIRPGSPRTRRPGRRLPPGGAVPGPRRESSACGGCAGDPAAVRRVRRAAGGGAANRRRRRPGRAGARGVLPGRVQHQRRHGHKLVGTAQRLVPGGWLFSTVDPGRRTRIPSATSSPVSTARWIWTGTRGPSARCDDRAPGWALCRRAGRGPGAYAAARRTAVVRGRR